MAGTNAQEYQLFAAVQILQWPPLHADTIHHAQPRELELHVLVSWSKSSNLTDQLLSHDRVLDQIFNVAIIFGKFKSKIQVPTNS